MSDKKSWKYQKDRYKQVNIKFDMNNMDDAMLHHFAVDRTQNTSRLIKRLIYEEMVRCAYEEV